MNRIHYKGLGDTIIDIVVYVSLIFLIIVTLYPFLNTLAVSFNDALDSSRGGIYLWPRKFSLYNYKSLLDRKQIFHASLVSVGRTVLSTLFCTFSTAMVAYTISRKDFVLRKLVSFIYVLTMYIDGGLVPTYFLIRSLGLTNNFWVYVLPGLVSAFNLIVVRTYINGLPDSLTESARVDGAGEFLIFWKIVLPLCKPVLATIALFVAVDNWNAWFDTFLYNSANAQLSTLQYELMKVLQSANTMTGSLLQALSRAAAGTSNTITPRAIRATMTVIVTVPIVIVYPFLQKYFVHGLTLGGVKE
ncbi:MAG: carbohydrate ABC transporter permease [Bacillota bacterium]|mgnify:CR=1 FL=1|nr:carbohydrate ABC transporter permease [Bacillota bacterium]HHU61745.1 carbohydrate ABC transporter permease [Natronincola sp.]